MAMYPCLSLPSLSFPTLTGSIVTFNAQYALPLKAHTVNIDSVSGVSAIGISATGLNLWGGKYLLQDFINMNLGGSFTYDDEKLLFGAGQMSGSKVIHTANFKANTRYTIILTGYNSYYGTATNMSVLYTDNTRTDIAFPNNTPNVKQTVRFVTTANKTVQAITGRNSGGNTTLYYNECCLLEGVHTADDFEPFGTFKHIDIGQTVNEGEYDARTGVMEVTLPSVQTIQLPPCPIDTLEGVNNIWADTGNTTLQYPKFV